MTSEVDLKPVLDFLSALELNNDRAWFDQHRAEFTLSQKHFEALVGELIDRFSAFAPLGGVTPKDCMMRIYRDVRFSRDKSPYRTTLAASIGPGGRKSTGFSYYFQVGSQGETMLAGGLYKPMPEMLARFRAAIDRDAAPFKKVIAGPDFKRTFGSLSGERLKTAPQGYDRNHPEIELLQLKEVVAMRTWPDEAVLRPDFVEDVTTAARALTPFLEYLNATVR